MLIIVNGRPREKKIMNTRTPAELLAAIEENGKEVDAALAKLGALLRFRWSTVGTPMLARSLRLLPRETVDPVSWFTNHCI